LLLLLLLLVLLLLMLVLVLVLLWFLSGSNCVACALNRAIARGSCSG
jgi:hypothetical protein